MTGTGTKLTAEQRERVATAVKDAFYEARDAGRTMHQAAEDARIFAAVEAVVDEHLAPSKGVGTSDREQSIAQITESLDTEPRFACVDCDFVGEMTTEAAHWHAAHEGHCVVELDDNVEDEEH